MQAGESYRELQLGVGRGSATPARTGLRVWVYSVVGVGWPWRVTRTGLPLRRLLKRGGLAMAKVLWCGDVVSGCKAVIEGKDVAEVMAKGAEHAKKDHGMATIPPDLAKKVQAAIKDK